MNNELIEKAGSWINLQDGVIKESEKVEESSTTQIKPTIDTKELMSKMMSPEVKAMLMKTLDGDEVLVDNVIKNIATEFTAFIPNLLGKTTGE